MLDGNAYRSLMQEDADADLLPRLRDRALLEAFAALKHDEFATPHGLPSTGQDRILPHHRVRKPTCIAAKVTTHVRVGSKCEGLALSICWPVYPR